MPVVNCPHCRAELDIDDADFGYRVQCPACHSAFTPDATPASPPPPPPPTDPDTLVVTCPRCQGKVGVGREDLGHDMRCPLCDRVFTATADRPSRRDDDRSPSWRAEGDSGQLPRYDDEKYDRRGPRYDDDDDRPRRRRSRYDDDSPEELIANAKRECGAAGVGMIVIACWGLFDSLLALVLYGAILSGAVGNGGFWAAFANVPEWQLWLNLGLGVLRLFSSGFLLYTGTQMRQAKQYGMCMIASIISMIPGVSPCCILGLVFGIMGVTKLNEHRVKRGFEANTPGYMGDGHN